MVTRALLRQAAGNVASSPRISTRRCSITPRRGDGHGPSSGGRPTPCSCRSPTAPSTPSSASSGRCSSPTRAGRSRRRGACWAWQHLPFNVWDRLEENEIADAVTAALAPLFPEPIPALSWRASPHGYHDAAVIAARSRRRRLHRPRPAIAPSPCRSRAPTRRGHPRMASARARRFATRSKRATPPARCRDRRRHRRRRPPLRRGVVDVPMRAGCQPTSWRSKGEAAGADRRAGDPLHGSHEWSELMTRAPSLPRPIRSHVSRGGTGARHAPQKRQNATVADSRWHGVRVHKRSATRQDPGGGNSHPNTLPRRSPLIARRPSAEHATAMTVSAWPFRPEIREEAARAPVPQHEQAFGRRHRSAPGAGEQEATVARKGRAAQHPD